MRQYCSNTNKKANVISKILVPNVSHLILICKFEYEMKPVCATTANPNLANAIQRASGCAGAVRSGAAADGHRLGNSLAGVVALRNCVYHRRLPRLVCRAACAQARRQLGAQLESHAASARHLLWPSLHFRCDWRCGTSACHTHCRRVRQRAPPLCADWLDFTW